MEFQYRDDQNQRTPLATPFSGVAYFSGNPLEGSKFMPGDFLDNVPTPNVFPTTMLINAEEAFQRELVKEQIQREREKEEIRKEIIFREAALAHRRELEEEVKREMVSERMASIHMQRIDGFSFPERVYVNLGSSYQRMMNHVNHINIYGRPQPQLPGQVDTRQPYTLTNTEKDKVTILAKPNVDDYGAKRKAVAPLAVDESESLGKKSKQEWSCTLCGITATSEKQLNVHQQGKKHKAKETFLRTQKIGFDSRPNHSRPNH